MAETFELLKQIDNYLKYMENIKSASPLTLKHYKVDLGQAFKYEENSKEKKSYSEEELLRMIREAFNTWAKLSLASRNRKAATLKSFFSWAFSEGLTKKDISYQITCPRVPKKIPHFLSVDECIAILKTFEPHSPSKEKILFCLLYGGGLRVSEACQLRWKEVNLQQGTLRVQGKGNKERLVSLPQLCKEALIQWQKLEREEFIFGEQALNPRTAYTIVQSLGKKAGLLKPLHPHALRHSFATHLLSSGANLRTLQELLGHESLQATEKYTHLGIDQLARTMENTHPLAKKLV